MPILTRRLRHDFVFGFHYIFLCFGSFSFLSSSSSSFTRLKFNHHHRRQTNALIHWYLWRIHLCLMHEKEKKTIKTAAVVIFSLSGRSVCVDNMDSIFEGSGFGFQYLLYGPHDSSRNKCAKVHSIHMPFAVARAPTIPSNMLRMVFHCDKRARFFAPDIQILQRAGIELSFWQ